MRALAQRHANVRIVQRANRCYDGGAIGEVLRAHPELGRLYKYFVLMNSSVRGPFLPRYYQSRPWTRAFTDLLSDEVKLVGTTISCEISVHIQSMVLATDRVGLGAIAAAGALGCPDSPHAAVLMYELASSAAILDAGHNIGCLLTRYRGIDWRAHRGARCNAALNPIGSSDGLSLNPFEIGFVKAKATLQVPTAAFLARYTRYYMHKPGSDDETLAELEANALVPAPTLPAGGGAAGGQAASAGGGAGRAASVGRGAGQAVNMSDREVGVGASNASLPLAR